MRATFRLSRVASCSATVSSSGVLCTGPIRGEYCCHVTSSQPITAHLGESHRQDGRLRLLQCRGEQLGPGLGEGDLESGGRRVWSSLRMRSVLTCSSAGSASVSAVARVSGLAPVSAVPSSSARTPGVSAVTSRRVSASWHQASQPSHCR